MGNLVEDFEKLSSCLILGGDMECDPRFASAWASIAFPPKLPSQLLEGLLDLEEGKSLLNVSTYSI